MQQLPGLQQELVGHRRADELQPDRQALRTQAQRQVQARQAQQGPGTAPQRVAGAGSGIRGLAGGAGASSTS